MGKTHLFDKKPMVLEQIKEVRLFVRSRKQGAHVASVPLKRLVKLSQCGFRNWRVEKVEGGWWLVLEAI
jgi:hypothetical protein